MKKSARKISKSAKQNIQQDKEVLHDFFFGAILFVIIQAIFMIGGLFIEKSMRVSITGIPSLIGILVVLAFGIYYSNKGRIYVLLGNFLLAFLAPLILYLITLFNFMSFAIPTLYYSMVMMVVIIIVVWVYLLNKLLKSNF